MIGDPTWTPWAVLLEAADEHGGSTIDPASLRRLVGAWSGPAPTWLYSPSRYALQVTVRATDPAAALAIAISRWTDARHRSCLPAWDVVRAEVLTPTELEREIAAAEATSTDTFLAPSAEQAVADELLTAALNDSVTGLPNREMFLDEVRRALAVPLGGVDVRAIVTVALHPTSIRPQPPDDLLADIGQRLCAAVRRGDRVARVGTAEFAALVTLPVGDHTDRVAERILQCVSVAGERHGRLLRPCVGVATACTADDPEELMMMAEAAMGPAGPTARDGYVSPRPKAV